MYVEVYICAASEARSSKWYCRYIASRHQTPTIYLYVYACVCVYIYNYNYIDAWQLAAEAKTNVLLNESKRMVMADAHA